MRRIYAQYFLRFNSDNFDKRFPPPWSKIITVKVLASIKKLAPFYLAEIKMSTSTLLYTKLVIE